MMPQVLLLAPGPCSPQVGWELSHHPFSRTNANGIATLGNIAGHCGQGEKRSDKLRTALKDTHATAHSSLGRTCPKVTPIVRYMESVITPKAWEKKWGYLIDNNHGSHHLPSAHKIFSVFTYMQNILIPFLIEHKFSLFSAASLKGRVSG